MAYGWIITRDHLAETSTSDSEVGTVGPADIPERMEAELKAGKGLTFRMYDDDGVLYYTGRAVWSPNSERALYGPLHDFGGPNAGAVVIKWHAHPEWTHEY